MLWGLFNSPPIREDPIYAIVDELGLTYIDKDYRDVGVQDGWLYYAGYNRSPDNKLVYLYRLR